ncbi:MAG: HAMP domain-containing sensor histidine kinase [Gemmatimonadaceae bacterium]
MISSMRARLALWHTSVLAVLLALFAAGAYAFVAHSGRARTDAAVSDAVNDLITGLAAERTGQTTTRAAAGEVMRELRFRTIAFVLYDASGAVVASSVPRPRPDEGEPADPPFDATRLGPLVAGGQVTRRTLVSIGDAEGGYRAALERVRFGDGTFIAAAAQSVHDEAETLTEARVAVLIAVPIALILAWVGGWLLARRSLAPMVEIREHAARIGASNLGERVPIASPNDEVGQLAAVINALLARLERAFSQQQQFMADASHELRTPVAVVQNEASLALSRPGRSPAEYEEALGVVRAAARRLRRIVDDLFLVARADAGEQPLRLVPVYLDEIVADCVRDARSLADARGVHLSSDQLPEAPTNGDELLLHRLILNLLDNAIKYSPAGATVTVRLAVTETDICVEVEDTGPGIPPDVQPRVFDRFVRADNARSHDADTLTSGAGLGLSIARWIAEAHGGSLDLDKSSGSGSLFVLRLPVPGV